MADKEIIRPPFEQEFPQVKPAGFRFFQQVADKINNALTRIGVIEAAPPGLALGETSLTAYRGDRGKTAYDHSLTAHAPATAEQNVNSDWTAASGDAQILNKPTLGTAAATDSAAYATAAQGAMADSAVQTETDPVFLASEAADFVAGDKAKLDGMAAGAEVNVNADWNAVSGDEEILNKPIIPTIKETISLTAQVVAIGTTTITSTSTAGLYRVSYSLLDTTADLTAGTITVNFTGTDDAGAFTMSSVALPLTALGRTQGTFFLRLSDTNSISYSTTLVGIIGASQYALFVSAEKLE